MTEFIGSRISLISKRDIRYVGTLHQISSEDATVALENVRSFGTEGRRPGEKDVEPSSTVYEYIVFRGSDVKDLRIEERPQEPEPPRPNMPDDPAILGNQRRPTPGSNAPQAAPSPLQHDQRNQQSGPQPPFPPGPNQRGPYQQMPYPPYGFPPQPHYGGPPGFPPGPGRGGPGGPGFPQMPYGAPPQYYGPGGFGPPHHMGPGQFPGQSMPIGPPGQQHGGPQPPQQLQAPIGGPEGPAAGKDERKPSHQQENKKTAPQKPQSSTATTPNPPPGSRGPAPPTETKPDIEAALAPPAPIQDQLDGQSNVVPVKQAPKIFPAIPLTGPTTSFGAPTASNAQAAVAAQGAAVGAAQTLAAKTAPNGSAAGIPSKPSSDDTARDARAAVAEAMAKLQVPRKLDVAGQDNLTKQFANLRTTAPPNGPQNGRRTSQSRGGRGGRSREPARKVEVPAEAFDFEASNAKFNKQDLAKEAIASGSPLQSPVDGASPPPVSSSDTAYNKQSSFFDNISSEIKERAEHVEQPVGGREFRNEERRKNIDTFGQGSVDSGFRYGGRGRARGRGRGGGRGRGRGYRGGQGQVPTEG